MAFPGCRHGPALTSSVESKVHLVLECRAVMDECAGPDERLKAFNDFWCHPSHSNFVDEELSAIYLGMATEALLQEGRDAFKCAYERALCSIYLKHHIIYISPERGVARSVETFQNVGPSREFMKNLTEINTFDGLVRFLAKKNPCKCLNDLKNQVHAGPKMGRCHVCFKADKEVNLFECSRCKVAHYCSKECQKADWKSHRDDCRRWTVKEE